MVTFTATEGKPKYFPAIFRPIPPEANLGMSGMMVELQRPGLSTGVVGASYEDPKMGPRCYVRFGSCSGWFSVYELEPVEPQDLPEPIDVFG